MGCVIAAILCAKARTLHGSAQLCWSGTLALGLKLHIMPYIKYIHSAFYRLE